MIFLLTSAGIKKGFRDIFLSLLPKPPQNISVSYITTAADGEEGAKSWINIAKEQLQALGISQIEDLDIKGKTENELFSILSAKDIILVNGGNTFYLLKHVRESGFDKVVKKLINEEKIYIGVSAGSYIVCPTIEQAHWKPQDRNDFGVIDLTGMGIVDFLITAHFKEETKDIVKEEVKSTSYPVVALSDNQAVLVKDNEVKVVGDRKKVFLNDFKEK